LFEIFSQREPEHKTARPSSRPLSLSDKGHLLPDFLLRRRSTRLLQEAGGLEEWRLPHAGAAVEHEDISAAAVPAAALGSESSAAMPTSVTSSSIFSRART
jgi:hypothetical protein